MKVSFVIPPAAAAVTAVVAACAIAGCARRPSEGTPVDAPRPAVVPAAAPRECATEDDCELARFDARERLACCTCTLVAVTHAAAAALRRTCDVRAPDASFSDGLCILSCLQAPGSHARCSDTGKCVVTPGSSTGPR